MNNMSFTFSDLVAGYVQSYTKDPVTNKESFVMKTSDDRDFTVNISANCYGEIVRNLGESYQDPGKSFADMLQPGRFVFAYGVFYPDTVAAGKGGYPAFDAKHLVYLGHGESELNFERPDWWLRQIRSLADFYFNVYFADGNVDFRKYRTNVTLTGQTSATGRQETDTISRLVYGFATAYMMSGDDRYLEAAEKGTKYLRDHMRVKDRDAGICYWYHAIDILAGDKEVKLLASEFDDDKGAIPCYEQIYALAGPTQTYRITGDQNILSDIEGTVKFFHHYFRDWSNYGGYFSHLDPVTLRPDVDSLAHNKLRKNWNSVGDHAPAYLINLWLATGEQQYADFLEYTFDTICERFPDYKNSPFVQEKFFHDWSADREWRWQQNRAVVGHNLKIAWNLMRMHSLKKKDTYEGLATKIGELMPVHGIDRQRGGCYDVVERVLEPGQTVHRFAWHDRKAWWQQEQGILAYLILHGLLNKDDDLKLARESSAFYNAWFLDNDSGGVYFNVLANGTPYLLGTERGKGSHSMAGYHAFELAFLATVYTNLLITKKPMNLYFKPRPGGFKDNILRVAPDILPAGSVRISEVLINGNTWKQFDAQALTVTLPTDLAEMKVRVRLVPTTTRFDALLIDIKNGNARIDVNGVLWAHDVTILRSVIQDARMQGATQLTIEADGLDSLCMEAARALAAAQRDLGGTPIVIVGANARVADVLQTVGIGAVLQPA